MSFTTTLYEGDSIIHFPHRARAPAKAPRKSAGEGAKTRRVVQHAHSKHRTRRGAIRVLFSAIWNALRSAGLWLEEKSMEAHYRRVDSYLAQSSNHAELERRIRELEHSDRLNWIDCGSR